MSDYSAVVDALFTDFQANVAGLAAATVVEHKYRPWDPSEFAAAPGDKAKHLAIWPIGGEEAATALPLTTDGGQLLAMIFRIAYWEHAGTESGEPKTSQSTAETAAAALFNLENAARARLFVKANFTLSGAVDDIRYVSTLFPETLSSVRWFVITARVWKSITAT